MKTVRCYHHLAHQCGWYTPREWRWVCWFYISVTKYWALLSDQAKCILSAEDQCGQHKCYLSTPQPLFLAVSYRLPKSGNCWFWKKVWNNSCFLSLFESFSNLCLLSKPVFSLNHFHTLEYVQEVKTNIIVVSLGVICNSAELKLRLSRSIDRILSWCPLPTCQQNPYFDSKTNRHLVRPNTIGKE